MKYVLNYLNKLLKSFGLTVIVSITLMSSINIFLGNNQLKTETLDNDYKKLLAIQNMQLGLVNMETGIRGYFLYRKVDYLEPKIFGETQFKRGFDTYSDYVKDSLKQKDILDRISYLEDKWSTTVDKIINDSYTVEQKDFNIKVNENSQSRKDLMDSLRENLSDLSDVQEARIKEEEDDFNSVRSSWKVLSVVLMGSFIFIFFNLTNELKRKEQLVKTLNRRLSIREE